MSRWSRLSRHLPLQTSRPTDAPVLEMETLEPGDGPPALPGQTVRVRLQASLEGGRALVLPDLGEEASFILGEGQVIRAVEEGLTGLGIGGVRRLTAPPGLAYGHEGVSGLVPPGATLSIELRVVAISPTPPPG